MSDLDDKFSWSKWSDKCPYCSKESLVKSAGNMFRALSGIIKCTSCSYRRSVSSHLACSLIQIEPLPRGALSTYDRDIDIGSIICDKKDDKDD